MKIGVFALFSIGLFVTAQEAAGAPLAYFAFFPIGFLAVFYFYDSKEWFFLFLSVSLLLLTYLLRRSASLPEETAALAGVTIASFGSLLYYEKIWKGLVKEEQGRRDKAQEELGDLRQKYASRTESLLHLEKQVASLINLFEIARDFNECLDLKETVQILFKKVLPELSFEEAKLMILSPSEKTILISKVFLITNQGVEEKSAVPSDVAEQEWLQKALQAKQFVSVDGVWLFPLVSEGEFNAIFSVRGPHQEDLAKFEVMTSQLALQIRKVRLYEMVRELSIIDGLTGVFVRRHFLERFEEEIRRARKHGFPLSVLMLDIDHFKRYNDEYGHLIGDVTLKEVTQVIRSQVRKVDIVARYGGEEFAMIIPETRREGALEVAERIRSAIARRSFRVYDEETKATVSIGISVFPDDVSESAEENYNPNMLFELLQKADRALYQAKEEGRNRVVFHGAVKGL